MQRSLLQFLKTKCRTKKSRSRRGLSQAWATRWILWCLRDEVTLQLFSNILAHIFTEISRGVVPLKSTNQTWPKWARRLRNRWGKLRQNKCTFRKAQRSCLTFYFTSSQREKNPPVTMRTMRKRFVWGEDKWGTEQGQKGILFLRGTLFY